MAGYTSVNIWLTDDDTYRHTVQAQSATVTRHRDFSIGSRSPAALRALSDVLLVAADALERQQRESE